MMTKTKQLTQDDLNKIRMELRELMTKFDDVNEEVKGGLKNIEKINKEATKEYVDSLVDHLSKLEEE